MNIQKVINNNVISVLNENQEELVVMGRGIAFQKRPGDPVDETKVEKVFSLKNKDLSDKFKTLLYEIPMENMAVSEEIVQMAKTTLGRDLNESIYVSLTDHIHFAIERKKNGVNIKNALLWEIKRLYRDEYAIGEAALLKIKQKLGVELPEDEAGFIAMHIVNAELNEEMPNVMNITKVIHDTLNIVKYYFGIQFDEESLNYYRFVTHLKFFAQRMFNHTPADGHDDSLFDTLKHKYPKAHGCTEKIQEYIQAQYNYTLTKEEMFYLMIHIERVVNRK